MSWPLSFRQHVLKIKAQEGLTFEATATRFNVGKSSLVRWTRCIEPKRYRNKPATKIDMVALKADIETSPDAYLYERAARFKVTPQGIRHALKRLGVTYKKRPNSIRKQTLLLARTL